MGVIVDFFMAFPLIFKYAFMGVKTIIDAITKPFKAAYNVSSGQVGKLYQSDASTVGGKVDGSATSNAVKNASLKQESQKEDNSFLGKLMKLLTSDISGTGAGKEISPKMAAKLELKKQALNKELANDTKRLKEGKVFQYEAKTKSGKYVKDQIFGFSKADINAYLLNEGLEPYSIESNKYIDFLYGDGPFSSRRMKNKDLIFFLTQLVTYIKAGITLTESMRILVNQSGKDRRKRSIYSSIVYELIMGTAFSEAINKQGNVFPPLLINMLKAAEATGELEETLDDMVEYYTEIESTRKEMVSAMTYPAFITGFAFTIVAFILVYVIPQFSQIYESMDVQISGMTLVLLNLSAFLQNYLLMMILIIVAIIGLIVLVYKKVKEIRQFMQVFFMKLPVFGNIIIYNEMSIFAKTFASLLKNNVNITESVDILSKITNNEIYKEIMIKTINNIAAGDKISDAFKDHWAIPEVAYNMIVTGESTGQLAEMMNRVAQFYQEQHRNIIASLKSLIEPIMIMTLAVMVGAILIAVIVPMFDMYDKLTLG
ncbi:MAG: type II secretion system F family protein [Bacilli bacterium]|nr:type II secretion system F family protein [Bacilli bacterium]